jgi:ABC-2 type transport system permease protein
MKNSWIIAMREWKERIGSRTFVMFSILGPLTVLTVLYMLFAYGGKTATKWNVLITDPSGLMDSKIASRIDSNIRYSFADNYIEIEDFANGKRFQQFDAMVEINEKVLSNKVGFVFYRQIPSKNLEKKVQYQVERRLEEIMVKRFTDLSAKDFKKINQPLNLSFRNVYDPHDFSQDKRAWVGLFLGLVIFVFIALFAMGLMRSISREKSNRIVEVLLGSVRPVQLLFGKILGIGMAAMFQFSIWFVTIAIGLILMRNNLFPDYINANLEDGVQVTEEVQNSRTFEKQLNTFEYNEFVDLVFERVQFAPMITAFVLCLIGGYLFYSSLFAAVGASVGSESDGQQFVIPLVLLLCLGVYAGYFAMVNPQAPLTNWFYYLPFTSPAVVLVKLAQGFNPGEAYSLFLVGFILLISSIFMLWVSGRIYKNGILQFGHRLKLRHIFKWTKQA